jgi:hypothetical protein
MLGTVSGTPKGFLRAMVVAQRHLADRPSRQSKSRSSLASEHIGCGKKVGACNNPELWFGP